MSSMANFRTRAADHPGHEIVGRIDAIGSDVEGLTMGERVGVPWLGHTCGVCPYCRMQRENLCDHPAFTGYTRDGGFATATIADARFALPLGEVGSDVSLAPLLCAGLIGWRSLTIAGDGKNSVSTASAPPLTSLPKSRGGRGDRYLALRGPETPPLRPSLERSAPPGRAGRTKRRRSHSTPPSSSRPSENSSRGR